MLKLIKAIFFFCLLSANLVFAQAKDIQLEYEVSRNGKAFAIVKETYKQEGEKYHIISTTKGEGLYALLGERVLTSNGDVTPQGLKPANFELKRGDNAKKSLSATFDWASNNLNMLVKGETRTATLTPGAQDLASYPYQFMFTSPKGDKVKVTLTTGKKIKLYEYSIKSHGEVVKAANKEYKTLHLVNDNLDGKERKELWLAESLHNIPVKYLVVEKDGTELEQTLVKISIK